MKKENILKLREMFCNLKKYKKEALNGHLVVFTQYRISGYIHALYDLELISYHTLSKIDRVIFS